MKITRSIRAFEENPCSRAPISDIQSRIIDVRITRLSIEFMNRRMGLAFLILFSSACGRCDSEKPTPIAPSASNSAASAPIASVIPERGSDGIEPVYPKIAGPPEPLAEKLCAALHDVPAKRRADCCSTTPGFSSANECVRTLSHALRDKSVSLDAAAVDACVAAMNAAHEGCEWVGPTNVSLPSACEGIIRGNIEEKKSCRSSLECAGDLRCLGVGPTDTGVCRKAPPAGYPCALAVDTLAALTRQDALDLQHPECDGYCTQRRCRDFLALHDACKISKECGEGRVCLGGTCEEGSLPGEGQPCPKNACASDLRCEKGTCFARKKAGSVCVTDGECRGGCLRGDGGKEGTCGMKCNMR